MVQGRSEGRAGWGELEGRGMSGPVMVAAWREGPQGRGHSTAPGTCGYGCLQDPQGVAGRSQGYLQSWSCRHGGIGCEGGTGWDSGRRGHPGVPPCSPSRRIRAQHRPQGDLTGRGPLTAPPPAGSLGGLGAWESWGVGGPQDLITLVLGVVSLSSGLYLGCVPRRAAVLGPPLLPDPHPQGGLLVAQGSACHPPRSVLARISAEMRHEGSPACCA